MSHADAARRVVDDECDCKEARKAAERDNVPPVLVTCVPCWRREQIAAALAAAERRGLERAADAANERLTHCHPVLEDRLGSCRACEQAHIERRIRALLPAAVAEPAAKCECRPCDGCRSKPDASDVVRHRNGCHGIDPGNMNGTSYEEPCPYCREPAAKCATCGQYPSRGWVPAERADGWVPCPSCAGGGA